MSNAKDRAAARAQWPVVRGGEDEPPAVLSGTEAWEAVMELTFEAYSLAGEIPDPLPRAQWASRLFRKGEPRADSHGF